MVDVEREGGPVLPGNRVAVHVYPAELQRARVGAGGAGVDADVPAVAGSQLRAARRVTGAVGTGQVDHLQLVPLVGRVVDVAGARGRGGLLHLRRGGPGGRRVQGRSRGGVFFFQAEDGIRDLTVTGVQTCALPILADTKSTSRSMSSAAVDRRRRSVTRQIMTARSFPSSPCGGARAVLRPARGSPSADLRDRKSVV